MGRRRGGIGVTDPFITLAGMALVLMLGAISAGVYALIDPLERIADALEEGST